MTDLIGRIEAGRRAVLAQTGILERGIGRVESRWKGDGTRVTAADVAISENILRELAALFPSDQFFSEELSGSPAPIPVTSRFSWVLDPIDGTNNFALGIPNVAISLALCEKGEPIYGIIYDFARRTLMHGGPGFGAHDGERQVSVSTTPPNPETIIGFQVPFDKTLTPMTSGVLGRFKIRSLGSATLHLAYVGAGIFDGLVDFNVKIWDLAAAIPFCRAAGGRVEFLNGEQLPMRTFDVGMKRIVYVAGSPSMCDLLKQLSGPLPVKSSTV